MTQPPLLAPDVDLRGLDYMPLFGNHLFGSEFNAAANDSEWRAALTLWWAAWNQVPAGSLPNDDTALCRLADLGRDVKTWKKLRTKALHGFVLCSDGRLYHEFLCAQAAVAWEKRVKERERKANWRAQQDAKKAGQNADVPGTKTGTSPPQNADVPADGKRMDGNGRDDEIPTPTHASADDPPEQPSRVSMEGAICIAIRAAGIAEVNPGHPDLQALIAAGAEVQNFVAAAKTAKGKGKGFAYVLGVVKGQLRDAQAMAVQGANAPAGPSETTYQRSMREKWEAATGRNRPQPAEVFDVTPVALG